MADSLIEVDKHLVPKEVVHFVLMRIMARAEPPHGAHFIWSVMINMHTGVLLPSLKHPVDEPLKRALFLVAVVRPSITEL
jgi:hypothetical protein